MCRCCYTWSVCSSSALADTVVSVCSPTVELRCEGSGRSAVHSPPARGRLPVSLGVPIYCVNHGTHTKNNEKKFIYSTKKQNRKYLRTRYSHALFFAFEGIGAAQLLYSKYTAPQHPEGLQYVFTFSSSLAPPHPHFLFCGKPSASGRGRVVRYKKRTHSLCVDLLSLPLHSGKREFAR